MSELNFSFPIVRDIEATRAKHQKTVCRLQRMDSDGIGVFYGLTPDDLYDSIMHVNYRLFMHYIAQHWRNQKGVKALKSLVNSHVRDLIGSYLSDNGLPVSWDTAYYLLHQDRIDGMMEAVSRLLHAELS